MPPPHDMLEEYAKGALLIASFAMFFFMSVIPSGGSLHTDVFAIYGRTKWVAGEIVFSFFRWIAAVCGALGVWFLAAGDGSPIDDHFMTNIALAITATLCMKASLAAATHWTFPGFAAFFAFVSFGVSLTFVILAFLDSDWLAGGLFIVYTVWALCAFFIFLGAAVTWKKTMNRIRAAVLTETHYRVAAARDFVAQMEDADKKLPGKDPWKKSRNRGFGFQNNGETHHHHGSRRTSRSRRSWEE